MLQVEEEVSQSRGREAQEQGIRKRGLGRNRLYKTLNYWQKTKTKITSVDPLSSSGSASSMRQRRGGDMITSRRNAIRPKSIGVYRSGKYWQRTKITGKYQFNLSGNKTPMGQAEVQIDPAGSGIQEAQAQPRDGNSTQMRQESRESTFYRTLGSKEKAELFSSTEVSNRPSKTQLNETRVRLGMRTLTDIFESSQREYEENITGRRTKRRRIQVAIEREELDGLDRVENEESVKSQEEELIKALHSLEEEFAEKERFFHGGVVVQTYST
jgi:hypothetical protein